MLVRLREIVKNPQEYKLCKGCSAYNKEKRDRCHHCDTCSFISIPIEKSIELEQNAIAENRLDERVEV